MSVLDPFEVAEIQMWSFWEEPSQARLYCAEFTVYFEALSASRFEAVLNEKEPATTDLIRLPESVRVPIFPDTGNWQEREHPDIRLARRARTIANLARVINERKVRIGIRKTLWAQAQRLETLAQQRFNELKRE